MSSSTDAAKDTKGLVTGWEGIKKKKRKKAAWGAASWNFFNKRGVAANYFGGSAAFGAAGLGAVVPAGLADAGFGAAPAVGAGTPDCAL